ncbi:hypothetical protein MRX96_033828 [Rhipicephalus microplus]
MTPKSAEGPCSVPSPAEADLHFGSPPDHVPQYREPDLSQALSVICRNDDDCIVGARSDRNACAPLRENLLQVERSVGELRSRSTWGYASKWDRLGQLSKIYHDNHRWRHPVSVD